MEQHELSHPAGGVQIALNALDGLVELSCKIGTITFSINFIPRYIKIHVHIHQNRYASMFMAIEYPRLNKL